jgi:undecaprenyl-diphosphatase
MATTHAPERPAIPPLRPDPWIETPRYVLHRRSALAVAGVVAILLAALAAWDGGSALGVLDVPVAEWVADVRFPGADSFFATASRMGDNTVVFAIAAVLAALTWRRCRYLAMALIAAAMFRPMMEFVLKAVVGRERPDISPVVEFSGPSHPSGHPMAAAALWGLLPAVVAMYVRSRAVWLASIAASVTVVVLVAASRVYRGAHWLTDVLGSLAWAALYLAAVQGVFDRLHLDRDCLHPHHDTTSCPRPLPAEERLGTPAAGD